MLHFLMCDLTRLQEREKKREEKRIREEFLKEWNKPREDMECDDLKVSILNSFSCPVSK